MSIPDRKFRGSGFPRVVSVACPAAGQNLAKNVSNRLNQTPRLFVPFIGKDDAFHYYVSAGSRDAYLTGGEHSAGHRTA